MNQLFLSLNFFLSWTFRAPGLAYSPIWFRGKRPYPEFFFKELFSLEYKLSSMYKLVNAYDGIQQKLTLVKYNY
jgi:hypothetical protein